MTSTPFVVVLITTPDKDSAVRISEILVKEKVAACVNIIPKVRSIFPWEGSISAEDETLLIVKSNSAFFEDRLVPLVRDHHPYDVPEIIALPIFKGSKPYMEWMEEETS